MKLENRRWIYIFQFSIFKFQGLASSFQRLVSKIFWLIMKNINQIGIVGYGGYVPRGRITVSEIAGVWKKEGEEMARSLGVLEKAAPFIDEDSVTLAIEAGRLALEKAKIGPEKLEAIFVGSESHPYAVNPTSTIVGEILGTGNNYLAADLEFACKAGTAGIQVLAGLIEAGRIKYGMAVGSDCSQAKPHDALEYTAGAGAGAFILGNKKAEFLAQIIDFTSYSSDTPDFWRRDGVSYPSHGGRFTGEPAYFAHVVGAGLALFKKSKTKAADFDYCVFHMPNGKFPKEAATRLGFTKEQLEPSMIVAQIGNPYSGSSLLGLATVLDSARENSLIFLVSYGSGAGADAFILETTKLLTEKRKRGKTVKNFIDDKEYLSYVEYLKRTHKI